MKKVFLKEYWISIIIMTILFILLDVFIFLGFFHMSDRNVISVTDMWKGTDGAFYIGGTNYKGDLSTYKTNQFIYNNVLLGFQYDIYTKGFLTNEIYSIRELPFD